MSLSLNNLLNSVYVTIPSSFSASSTLNIARRYFSVGDSIYLKGFLTGTTPVEVTALNGIQTIQAVTSNTISFVVRGYNTSNASVGVSGFIKAFTAKDASNNVYITTDRPHGLINNQKITITSTGVAGLDSDWDVTVTGSDTFYVNVGAAVVAGGAIGVWNIKVSNPDTSSIIESNKYRSITAPSEILPEFPNGNTTQLQSLRTYLSTIIDNLKSEPNSVIESIKSGSVDNTISNRIGLKDFNSTIKASTRLEFTVPAGVANGYFYRIYRSEIYEALTVEDPLEIIPAADYFFLTQETYASANKTNRQTIVYHDTQSTTIDQFNQSLKLYTSNSATGDQDPNDYPPFAHDITLFKDYAIYASTKLKQLKGLTLLGVSLIKDALDAASPPKLIISDSTQTNRTVYEFVRGKKQVVTMNFDSTTSVSYGDYFLIDVVGQTLVSLNGSYKYCFYYSDGLTTQPNLPNVDEFIPIYVDDVSSLVLVANKTSSVMNELSQDFTSTVTSPSSGTYKITITYSNDGFLLVPTFVDTVPTAVPPTFAITTNGEGEDLVNKKVAIPSDELITPETQTILTIKSLARIINRTTSDLSSSSEVYCYYDSEQQSDFTLEGMLFKNDPFYVLANKLELGNSFTPPITANEGTGVSDAGSGNVNLTINSHNFSNNDQIVLFDVEDNPNLYGVFTVKYIDQNTVQIQTPLSINFGSKTFKYKKAKEASKSDNFTKKNRLYYSKAGIPEAVYNNVFLGSYQDIASEEKEILRVVPLRESLFVFKEDGLYRLSGTSAPFNEALFDSSCILTAPDSVAISGNVIYCWTRQGITVVSESGTSIASRPIDTEILKLGSVNYTGFKSATFGVGYESDNSYLVWTVSSVSDQIATQAFRYSSLTGSWTKYTKTNTCGLVNPTDDVLYLGAADISYLEKERKQFNREDYADRE